MKRTIARTLVLRVASPLTFIMLCVTGIMRGGYSAEEISADLLASSFILMYYPLSFETVPKSLGFVLGQMLFYELIVLLGVGGMDICLAITAASVPGLVLYTLVRVIERFKNVKVLFRVDSIWCAVEDYARNIYLSALGILALSALTACRFEAPSWVFAIHIFIMVIFLALSYLRAYTGSTVLIGVEREKAIKRVIQGNMRSVPEYGSPDDHMNMVYNKVIRVMETKKPYLDQSFTLDDLAETVFSNKLYLSKAINYYSGRNFRQFVNYYRVMYATELMKHERNLRMVQIALRCGFHSAVSFNMAFKLFMNMTPSAYYALIGSKAKVSLTA